MLEEMAFFNNPWDYLQQPAHPGQGINAAYRTLLSAIDQGWQVESITHKASVLRRRGVLPVCAALRRTGPDAPLYGSGRGGSRGFYSQ